MPPAARLVLAPGAAVYVGGVAAQRHRHHAVQAIHALGEPFELRLDSRAVLRAGAALVPADVAHALQASGVATVLALFDASGPRGRTLDAFAHGLLGQDLSPRIGPMPALPADPAAALAWWEDWLGRAGCSLSLDLPVSPRIGAALAWLDRAIGVGMPRLREAARAAGLSTSRLTHLFTAEVGIPFRRYILWLRIKRAIEQVRHGKDLTEAAVRAGFSDSAHLSRTFRETFGLAPSSALHDVRFAGCFCR